MKRRPAERPHPSADHRYADLREICDIFGISIDYALDLHRARDMNGFPSVYQGGPRKIRVMVSEAFAYFQAVQRNSDPLKNRRRAS